MDRRSDRRAVIGVLVVLTALTMGRNPVLGAESPRDFFKGKTITWIVSSETGGPADLMARTIAPFLAKELDAKVRVENKKTDEGVNYVYKHGTRDGLTLGIKDSDGMIGGEIMKAPGVQYETDKLLMVADVNPLKILFQISPKLPYKTLDALRDAKGLKTGASSARGAKVARSVVLLEILGLDGKIISGFRGTKAVIMAIARGEIDFLVQSETTAARDEKDGFLINLFVLGDQRSEVLPNVPTLAELGVKIPKKMEVPYKFVSAGGTVVFLPPAVQPERVDYLRMAFKKLGNINALQDSLVKLTGCKRPFVPGEEVQRDMAEIKGDKELGATLDTLFKKYTAVR